MKPKRPGSALGKAMFALEILASSGEPLTFTGLLERTGMAKGSLHRLLGSLLEEGLISHDESTRTYELGLRLLALTYDSDGGQAIRRLAASALDELSRATGETIHLAVLDGTEVVYIDKMESTHKVRMYSDVGLRAPVYCTGVGKALLAFRPADEQRRVIDQIDFQSFTPSTITSKAALTRELERIAGRGYALDEAEHEEEIRCAAAPILGQRGSSIASISISAPAYRAEKAMDEWVRLVVDAAAQVSSRMRTGGEGN